MDLSTIPTAETAQPGFLGIPDLSKSDWWHAYANDNASARSDDKPVLQPEIELEDFKTIMSSPEPEPDIELTPVTVEDIEIEARRAYLDTLYRSRAPLVFYAKATLPKQALKAQRSLTTQIYHKLLHYAVCPEITNLDRKYKDYLPAFIKATMTALPIELDQIHLATGEAESIVDWLEGCRAESLNIVPDMIIAKQLNQLKTREYQLIVLLMLECMSDSEADNEIVHAAELYIDILIDRLMISQSLDLVSHDDQLRTFCIEVITPFYSSRAPAIVKKLALKCNAYIHPVSSSSSTADAADRKRKRSKVGEDSREQRSAKIKRTRSAPANLLSNKKTIAKRSTLRREVSMNKKVPIPEAIAFCGLDCEASGMSSGICVGVTWVLAEASVLETLSRGLAASAIDQYRSNE